MLPDELERYLHRHIPLTRAMRVSAIDVGEQSVTLRAPLEPNINHNGTAFGGSASALAMLAAWSLLRTRLDAVGVSARVVIRRNTMEYEAPIAGDFEAHASIAEPGEWESFLTVFQSRGKARIRVSTVLEQDGQIAAQFAGEFVALRSKS